MLRGIVYKGKVRLDFEDVEFGNTVKFTVGEVSNDESSLIDEEKEKKEIAKVGKLNYMLNLIETSQQELEVERIKKITNFERYTSIKDAIQGSIHIFNLLNGSVK